VDIGVLADEQIAQSAGANVVSTTSSSEKGERLKSLGADHIINYRSDSEWGTSAKKLTGGRGFDHIVEVGGPGTIDQSLKAIAPEGVISMIGALDVQQSNPAPMMSIFSSNCIARGIMVGSREHLEELTKGMKAGGFKPVIDEKVFKFDQTREAYEYMGEQKHFGKVCITFD
jgi:NADPH:quinone reductase-like Zn-dependent oxidoreductase